MCILYHDNCPTQENAFNGLKKQCPNVHMYKVNTKKSYDLRLKYADGKPRPFFVFYRSGIVDFEIKYNQSWSENEKVVRNTLARNNLDDGNEGFLSYYNPKDDKIYQLRSMMDFSAAFATTGSKTMAVYFHDGSQETQNGWRQMKPDYPNIHMYKVCITETDDQKKLTTSDETPQTYIKFYQNGKDVEKVTSQFSWSSQEPVIKECMNRYSGNKPEVEQSNWSMLGSIS